MIMITLNGCIPEHVAVSGKSWYRWKVYIDEPGTMKVDVSYSYQGLPGKNSISIKAAGTSLHHDIQSTGITVGEPGDDWIIDSYNSKMLGMISFSTEGYYDIILEINANDNSPVNFQWLWMQ